MSREAMQQALEALELLARYENPDTKIQSRKKDGGPIVTIYPHKVASDAAQALRAALEAPEPEPFGYFRYAPHFDAWVQNRDGNVGTAFYTAPRERAALDAPEPEPVFNCPRCGHCCPQPAAWVGLTDKEIQTVVNKVASGEYQYSDTFARAIEAKLKEKNAA